MDIQRSICNIYFLDIFNKIALFKYGEYAKWQKWPPSWSGSEKLVNSGPNGKQIYSGTIGKDQPLDVSNYTPGMYLVTIENKEANKKNTYKIIKK